MNPRALATDGMVLLPGGYLWVGAVILLRSPYKPCSSCLHLRLGMDEPYRKLLVARCT